MAPLTAQAIRETLRRNPPRSVTDWRPLRRRWSRQLNSRPPRDTIEIAVELLDTRPWGRVTAYELIAAHPRAIAALVPADVRRLGEGLDDWGSVDAFACYVAGPAWREGLLPNREIHAWLRSADRWQRRAAVVATVALNVRARGGRGDVDRTLDVCRRVVGDTDDMVIKALSWALRSLVQWDRAAVAEFVRTHDDALAARVKREVAAKLRTGRKG